VKTIIIALLVSGCLAQTEYTCPVTSCGWVDDAETGIASCEGELSSQKRFELLNEGASACWIYDSSCVPNGTRAECVPDLCRRKHVTCQPTDRTLGRP
jgi:hypothetical protein